MAGSRNTVVLQGSCAGLSVRGDANTLTVEFAAGASIDVEGSGNRLRFTVAGLGAGPAVRLVGNDSVIAAVSATGAGGPIQLTGDNQSVVLDCGGQNVTIAGNHARLELRGGCAGLVAHGDANRVTATLRPGASVEVEGNGTSVDYSVSEPGAEPRVRVLGKGSQITRSGQRQPAEPESASAVAPAVAPALVMNQPPVESHLAQTMHDLGAKIVPAGTLVALPAAALFDGASDELSGAAAARISQVADLAAQTHPGAIVVTARDAADPSLALRRAQAVAAAMVRPAAPFTVQPKGEVAAGAATVELLLLR